MVRRPLEFKDTQLNFKKDTVTKRSVIYISVFTLSIHATSFQKYSYNIHMLNLYTNDYTDF
jgi:hypothetical protein